MPYFDRRTVRVKKRMDTWTGSIRTDVRMTVTSGESEEGAAFVSEAILLSPHIQQRSEARKENGRNLLSSGRGGYCVSVHSVLLCVFQTSQVETDARPAGLASPDPGSVSPGSA